MNLGGCLITTQKKESGGAPFPVTSANNGASVDPVTGKIVFGNSVGAAGDPAQLLDIREILLNAFYLKFTQGNITDFFSGPDMVMLIEGGIIMTRISLTTEGTQGVPVYGASNGIFIGVLPAP